MGFFTRSEEERILGAIRSAEAACSGELRVHVARRCSCDDVRDAAAHIFHRLRMERTRERNGVLFYLASADRRFAVLGDAGINARVPPGFWDGVVERLAVAFRAGDFAGGLCEGIELCGEQLAKYFPPRPDDVNELPDDISYGRD